jgi:uncharacterized protein (TIGR02217 family)
LFHNSLFPLTVAALGAAPSWAVDVVQLGGGAEQRIATQGDSIRRYNAATAITRISDFDAIVHHFNGRRSMLFSFPLKDQTLFKVTLEPLGTGGGVASTNQLTLNEGDATNAYGREIYLPKTGTIHIFAGVTEKVEGTDWTLAYTGATAGRVTWLTSVTGQTLTWTGEFYIPVRYDLETLPEAEVFAMLSSTVGLRRPASIGLVEVRYLSEF